MPDHPFTVEALPGYNVTLWPRRVNGRLVATRVMVAANRPGLVVNGTVLRQIPVQRLLEEGPR